MSYIPNIEGEESLLNTSETPLSSSATFMGTAEQNNWADVMVQVATDQDGTLYCEFSSDGTNWDTSLSFNYRTDRINPPHIFVKGSRYFRVRFTNTSASAQTYLRLHTYYGKFQKLTSPANTLLAESYDAISTRPNDFHMEVAAGKRQGYKTWNKFGYNDDVDTAAPEVVASFGGQYVPPTTAETLTISSSSDNDTVTTGSGVRSIVIYGIDENREEQIEVVNMTGTTPVITSSLWLGINRVAPFLCGTSKHNEGTITIINTTSTDILAEMPATKSVTQQCIFHIQANHTYLITSVFINILKIVGAGTQPNVIIRGFVYSPVANATIQIFKAKLDIALDNNINMIFSEPFPIDEKGVLYFTAETDVNNTSIDMRFSGIEIRNS